MGQDPLAIERLFYLMTAPQNPFVPQIPLVSGIDIALWDLAGKILGLPVYRLLGGRMRKAVPIYAHGRVTNMLDLSECRNWAQKQKSDPGGFRTYKFGVGVGERQGGERGSGAPWPPTVDGFDLRKVAKGYANLREAVGSGIDIAMHCTGQFDLPSAIGLCKAIEPVDPMWIEDPHSSRSCLRRWHHRLPQDRGLLRLNTHAHGFAYRASLAGSVLCGSSYRRRGAEPVQDREPHWRISRT